MIVLIRLKISVKNGSLKTEELNYIMPLYNSEIRLLILQKFPQHIDGHHRGYFDIF
jgi:hypothetical protein